jgi:Flp pilus assembly pilin Flp
MTLALNRRQFCTPTLPLQGRKSPGIRTLPACRPALANLGRIHCSPVRTVTSLSGRTESRPGQPREGNHGGPSRVSDDTPVCGVSDMKNLLKRLVSEDRGQDVIEYALLAAGISIIVIPTAPLIGDEVDLAYQAILTAVGNLT